MLVRVGDEPGSPTLFFEQISGTFRLKVTLLGPVERCRSWEEKVLNFQAFLHLQDPVRPSLSEAQKEKFGL